MRTPTIAALLLAAAVSFATLAPAHAASPATKSPVASEAAATPKPSTCSLPDLACKTTTAGAAPQTNLGCTASCLPDQGKAVCSAGKCESGQFTKMNTCQCTR